jgi:putative chitinase
MATFGLDRPHRLVQLVSQIMHESGDFRYDREIWGPTPAQSRYDSRADLGNTPALDGDGDGKKYLGRTAMQLTGKANYQAFMDWCQAKGLNPPDFVSWCRSGIGTAVTSTAMPIRAISKPSQSGSMAA